MYNHPTSLRQDQSVAVATTNVELKMQDNVTKPTLYAYIWIPLRLVKVGIRLRFSYIILHY